MPFPVKQQTADASLRYTISQAAVFIVGGEQKKIAGASITTAGAALQIRPPPCCCRSASRQGRKPHERAPPSVPLMGQAFGRRSEAASGAPAERPAAGALPAGAQAPVSLHEAAERFDAAQAGDHPAGTVHPHHPPGAAQDPTVTRGTLYLQGSDFVHFAFAAPEDLILHLTPRP